MRERITKFLTSFGPTGKRIVFLKNVLRKRYGNRKRLLKKKLIDSPFDKCRLESPGKSIIDRDYPPSPYRIAVAAHIYHDELAGEFASYFMNIAFAFDLYISTKPEAQERLQTFFSREFAQSNVEVKAIENRGRDMAPFLITFKDVYPRYDLVCWVHSKRSEEYNDKLSGWRSFLLDSLLGSKNRVFEIIELFSHTPRLGVVSPRHYPPILCDIGWGSNFELTKKLANRMSISLNASTTPDFPSGGMFWFRPTALAPLFNLGLSLSDFERGSERKIDGTLAHAIERLIFAVARAGGYYSTRVKEICSDAGCVDHS